MLAGASRTVLFPVTRHGTVRRARVVFPNAGRWRYGLRIGRRTTFVGTVQVQPPRVRLREPFDIVEEPGGTYLLADHTANAVDRLRGRELQKVATARGARDLERAPDGRILVASGRNVLAFDPASRRIETVATADNDVLGVAASDGGIVVSDFGSRLLRFAGGRKEVLLTGLEGVHGLLATDAGLVFCESSTGRVLRLTRAGSVDVLATGLDRPSFAVLAAGGALYVSEFGADRVVRVTRGGVTPVARVPSPAGISLSSEGRLLVASLSGRVASVDPATGRLTWLV